MAGIAGISLSRPPAFSSSTSISLSSTPRFVHFALPSRLMSRSTHRHRRAGRYATRLAATARYGGGGGGGFRPRWDEEEEAETDEPSDPALDLTRIQSSTVRLLDQQQNMIGVISKNEAIRKAEDAGLILVILSLEADPPVLKLFEEEDYEKHMYEQEKKKKDSQKKSSAKRMQLKEVKMGYKIDIHDYSVRLKSAKKFLMDGDKVKVIVNLKGRQHEFRNVAIARMKQFENDIGELAKVETKNLEERNIYMVLMPNKVVIQKILDQQEKEVPEVSQDQPKEEETSEVSQDQPKEEETSEVSASV